MKKLMIVALGLAFAAGIAVAGNIDAPGAPSAGSGMYTLQNLYDYLISGTALSVVGSFQEPTAGPASTMKSTKQIGDDVKALFDQCDATASDVSSGKKFFSTVGGSWGVQTGTGGGGGGGGLLKTGQTSSYQTGDDGYYQKGVDFSYTDNGDGTTTDNSTGLMWATSGTGAGCASGASLSWSAALVWAEGLTFAGYSDWRLPNLYEGYTLTHYVGVYPFYNASWVQLVPGSDSFFWTGTTYERSGPSETYRGFAKRDTYSEYEVKYKTQDPACEEECQPGARVRVRVVRGGN